MKRTMTTGELIEAILNAESLEDLQHRITRTQGPSEDEYQRAVERLATIESLYYSHVESYGPDMSLWPQHVKARYDRLNQEQKDYELKYY